MQFGGIAVEPETRTLLLDGVARHLEPQAFDLLVYLVAHRDRVVSKEELLDEVWGDQFVSEYALTTRVKEIRQAVGDDGTRQEVLKNFRGRGYRWVASEAVATPNHQRLVGRDTEIRRIAELLETSPIVTIVGPGGAGKTSVMGEVTRRLRDTGVESDIVELAPVPDADGVLAAIVLELGVGAGDGDDAALMTVVAETADLLVLDNCEHVVERVAQIVEAVTRHNPTLRVLSTSRERLGVSGEQVVPLGALDPAAAAELLGRRTSEADPHFSLGEHDALDDLLDLVDHLPLGIEMVASHLPTLGVRSLVDHLEAGGSGLRSPNRGADGRHRDLRSVADWSLQLLDPAVRSTLADLSVFAGPATLEQIAAVLGGDAGALALGPISELVGKSLVVVDTSSEPATYGLLETIRAVVRPERPAATDARHAAAVAAEARALSRALLTPDEPAAAVAFDALTREIRAAFHWARGHDTDLARRLVLASSVYAHERQWPEPGRWCASLTEGVAVDELDPMLAAVLANDASNRGDYQRTQELVDQALTSDVPAVRASALDARSSTGMYTGDLEATRKAGRQVRELARETGDPYMWALGHLDVVLGNVFDGRLEQARAALEGDTPPAPCSPTSNAWLAYTEAELLLAEGDVDAAIEGFERAIRIARPIGSRYVVTVSEVARLSALARSGDPAHALATFEPLIDRYRRLHSTTHVVTALRHVVVLLGRVGEAQAAMQILGTLQTLDRLSYGEEATLLEATKAGAVQAHGIAVVDAWLQDGRMHDLPRAVDIAAGALAAAQT